MPRRPNLFIIGAPRSGTTSLHRYLQEHPDIYMSRTKEPGYFAPDVLGGRADLQSRYPDGETEYLALFTNAQSETWIGESSTIYLMSRRAPFLIRAFDPKARLIVMLRNPVDMIHSQYTERLAGGAESIGDFEQALEADADRRAGKRLPRKYQGYGVAYRDNACLGEQLERWLGEFAHDQIHLIVYDDFVADTPSEFAKVLRFLAVDEHVKPSSFETYNASQRPRKGVARLARPLLRNRFSRWASGRALPAIIGEQRTVRLSKQFGARRLTKQPIRRDPLSAELRTRLQREFEPDVRKLSELIGRDLVQEWFRVSDQIAAPAESSSLRVHPS
jgi:hypothetical protein